MPEPIATVFVECLPAKRGEKCLPQNLLSMTLRFDGNAIRQMFVPIKVTCLCWAPSHICETGKNLSTRLTQNKRTSSQWLLFEFTFFNKVNFFLLNGFLDDENTKLKVNCIMEKKNELTLTYFS